MSYSFRSLFAVLLVSPFLANCVPTGQDITNLDLRVRNLDGKVLLMNQKVEEVAKKATQNKTIEEIQEKQADMSNTLDRLNMEFLQIKGQLEENTHFYQNSKETAKQLGDSVDKRLNDLSEQIMILVDQLNKTAGDIDDVKKSSEDNKAKVLTAQSRVAEMEQKAASAIAEAERRAAEAQRMAAEAAAVAEAEAQKTSKIPTLEPAQMKNAYKDGKRENAPVAATGNASAPAEGEPKIEAGVEPAGESTAEPVASGPGKEMYDEGLTLFREGKFNQAYRTFTNYIEQYPTGKMAPNVRFWMGDCFYNQQQYELAILEYQKVIADYAKHPKAAAALLKQGLAFEKLKDKETAVIVYKKLMEEYPRSEQYGVAKKRVESLK